MASGGALVARPPFMQGDPATAGQHPAGDFGVRRRMDDGTLGRVEVLDLIPALATPAAERAIRARVAAIDRRGPEGLLPAYRLERDGARLSVISVMEEGVRLRDLLAELELGTASLPADALVALAAACVRTVSRLHVTLDPLSHGSLTPAHVLVRRDGEVLLTDGVFGDALEQLEGSRGMLWRGFSIAMPPSAATARFDRRADVTQLGSIVLAIFLRRRVLMHEYPGSVADLVMTAAKGSHLSATGSSRLRTWLQQALQLQSRAVFPSALEAGVAFADVVESLSPQPGGEAAVRKAVHLLLDGAEAAPLCAPPSRVAQQRVELVRPPLGMSAAPGLLARVRAVLPNPRAT